MIFFISLVKQVGSKSKCGHLACYDLVKSGQIWSVFSAHHFPKTSLMLAHLQVRDEVTSSLEHEKSNDHKIDLCFFFHSISVSNEKMI